MFLIIQYLDRTLKALNYKVTICITHHFLFQETFSLSPWNYQHLHHSSFLIQETHFIVRKLSAFSSPFISCSRNSNSLSLIQEPSILFWSYVHVPVYMHAMLHHYEFRKDDCFWYYFVIHLLTDEWYHRFLIMYHYFCENLLCNWYTLYDQKKSGTDTGNQTGNSSILPPFRYTLGFEPTP